MIIRTPSRLHLTLIDLNGFYGRVDGGVGITLKNPHLSLRAESGDQGIEVKFKEDISSSIHADYTFKIKESASKMLNFLGEQDGITFKVENIYPPHSGLGSGTQIALAVGKIISLHLEKDLSTPEIANIVGRGGTSGIGVAAFDKGGLIIDGGHSRDEKPKFLPSSASKATAPPILARYPIPNHWNFIVVIPRLDDNVSGKKEVNIFQEYCPIPLSEVRELSHIILMKMMPAIIEEDLTSFGDAINLIQNVGFKKIENQLQNPLISKLINYLRESGASGVGMSSFGPTIYAMTDNDTLQIKKAAREVMGDEGEIIITKAQNHGAIIN